MNDQHYYEIVAQELQDHSIRPGLWTRAVAKTGEEGARARALYIRFRVAELVQEEKLECTRAAAEAKRLESEQRRQQETEFLAQAEEKRRRVLQAEAERSRLEWERAANPHLWLFIIGGILLLLILLFLLGHILSK